MLRIALTAFLYCIFGQGLVAQTMLNAPPGNYDPTSRAKIADLARAAKITPDARLKLRPKYKMRKNRAGAWKLRNVTIEAINLGKVYQSQFSSAAKQYKGDIDAVIDNWTVDPTSKDADA